MKRRQFEEYCVSLACALLNVLQTVLRHRFPVLDSLAVTGSAFAPPVLLFAPLLSALYSVSLPASASQHSVPPLSPSLRRLCTVIILCFHFVAAKDFNAPAANAKCTFLMTATLHLRQQQQYKAEPNNSSSVAHTCSWQEGRGGCNRQHYSGSD